MRTARRGDTTRILLGLGLLWALSTAVLTAQNITGSIFGTVTDESGSRLPGVTVTVRGPQLIADQGVQVTNARGEYRFTALPPGTYSVTFELAGFRAMRQEGIALSAGRSLPVDGKLLIATVEETVNVTGAAPVVDTRNSALMDTVSAEVLENLPIQREFTKILNLLPGVTDGRYDFAPVNNVHGSSLRQNVYSMDGMNTVDPSSNATSTLLPPDAMQEVQVTTAGIPAEYGDASGGVFNFITKSGGNDFSGGANFYLQSKSLQSDNVSSELKAQGVGGGAGFDHLYDAGGLLGGPIQRNRAWFFANYRYLNQDEIRSDFAAPLTTRDKTLFTKGTVQLSTANKVDGSFYYRKYRNFPYTAVASFRNSGDPRTWMAVDKENFIIIPRWTSMLTNTTLLEVRASVSIFKLLAADPNADGSPAYIDQATGIISGGNDQLFGDNRRNLHQFKADLSQYRDRWLGGSHSFKVGFDWGRGPVYQQRFVQGARGPNELAGCTDKCISITPDTQHLLFNGAPFGVRLWNSPRIQRFENRTWDFYAQDQWVVGNRLTLNLGARVEHVTGSLPESSGGGGQWETVETIFPAQNGLINVTNWSPRAGGVFDVRGDHKSTIKVSAGRFYTRLATGYVGTVSPAGIGYLQYDWVDSNGDLIYQPGEETILRADTRPNPARLPAIDPDLKNQYTDVYTAGFEQSIRSDLSVAATAIVKRDRNLIGTINAAVPFSAYDQISVTNPVSGQAMQVYTLRPEFRGLPGQIVLTNPGNRPGDTEKLQRNYTALELVLRRRMQDNWQFEASYVLAKAEGNVGNSFSDSFSADYTNPNLLINRLGDLSNTPRHQLKLLGSYLAPWGVQVSGYLEALSGLPWTENLLGGGTSVKGAATVRFLQSQYPQILSENFIDVAGERAGTRRMDRQVRFDLRLEKRFNVGKGDLSGMVDIFNLFNNAGVILIRDLRYDNPNFGVPAQLQLPRQIRLGVKWTF